MNRFRLSLDDSDIRNGPQMKLFVYDDGAVQFAIHRSGRNAGDIIIDKDEATMLAHWLVDKIRERTG